MKTKIKKDWYGRLKSIEELHNDSILWLSEIDFVNDEIRFLNHLLSSNYIDFLDAGLLNKTKELIVKISDEKKTGTSLYKLIRDHERILSDLIETKSVTSNKNYLLTHEKFERKIDKFFRKYKELKKQIFKIVEKVMRKKEQKKLI